MGKKAIVVISLIEESNKMSNEKIKREIFEEISRDYSTIPWCKEIVEVKVIRER